jgi:hypothetical protein
VGTSYAAAAALCAPVRSVQLMKVPAI